MVEQVADATIGGTALSSVDDIGPYIPDQWQENVTRLMVLRRNLGVGSEMGMGKTPPTLQALHELNPPSSLIVVTKRAFIGWRRQMRQWFPGMFEKYTVIIERNQAKREAQWNAKPTHVITTWDWLIRDGKAGRIKRFDYNQVTVDEAHKYIRGRKTISFEMLCKMSYVGIFIVTGSPISGNAAQFWTYLHLMNRKEFSSYWRFVNTFCFVDDGPWGKQVYGIRNLEALQSVLRRYFVLLRKTDLGPAKKRRLFLDCEMTEPQRKAYEQYRDELILELESGEFIVSPSPMTAAIRLRQLLCCPAILDPRLGYGGSLLTIVDELKEMERADQHCTIFTPFRDAVPLIQKCVHETLNLPTFAFMGGLEPDELEQQLAKWRLQKAIGVCTIKYAESFDMETTDKGFFCGYEWDPFENYQAEDRVDRRNNLHKLIRMFYARLIGTYDENIMSSLVFKAGNINKIYNDRQKLKSLLQMKTESVT